MATALDREWDRLGRPARFSVIDAGAGPGTLARGIHAAAPRCLASLDYVCVELSEAQRVSHPEWVTSRADMPAGRITGVVLANELLDNLPFAPARRMAGAIRSARVTLTGERLEPWWDDSEQHAETFVAQDAAGAWLLDAVELVEAGRVIIIDYCRENSADVEIRTYARHARAGEPLEGLGTKDITVDVDLAQLQQRVRPARSIRSQAEWLHDHGLDDLVDAGRAAWEAGADMGDLAALKGRSRVREAEALTDPDGLGGFTVAEWVID
ncbi:MAG: SAM-dependent methyltransferase [Acidimicrobiales bacterium]